jgi:hypothetical protein
MKSEFILACLMVICNDVLMIKMSVTMNGYDINFDSRQKSDCSLFIPAENAALCNMYYRNLRLFLCHKKSININDIGYKM